VIFHELEFPICPLKCNVDFKIIIEFKIIIIGFWANINFKSHMTFENLMDKKKKKKKKKTCLTIYPDDITIDKRVWMVMGLITGP